MVIKLPSALTCILLFVFITNLSAQPLRQNYNVRIPFTVLDHIMIEISVNANHSTHKFVLDNNASFIIDSGHVIAREINLDKKLPFKAPAFTPGITGKQQIIKAVDIFKTADLSFKTDFIVIMDFFPPELKGNGVAGIIGWPIFNNIIKIDFSENSISWASERDSIKNLDLSNKIGAKFKKRLMRKEVQIPVTINNETFVCHLDFGYNGSVLLPHKDFRKALKDYPATLETKEFVTLGGVEKADLYSVDSTEMHIGGVKMHAKVDYISSYKNNYGLIGLSLLKKLKYVLIDYKDNELYFVQ